MVNMPHAVELESDKLVFRFPGVHPDAALTIAFHRTLRIPSDGQSYPMPSQLGRFPMVPVDDYPRRAPESWLQHGGVMLPIRRSEALWVRFSSAPATELQIPYPFAVKIAAGKLNAVNGEPWAETFMPGNQDYLVVPPQAWLDGFCVGPGKVGQFVAHPLHEGETAEEKVTGKALVGGIQLAVYPMKRRSFFQTLGRLVDESTGTAGVKEATAVFSADMGLAPGGTMRQEVLADPHGDGNWDQDFKARCFVHLADPWAWRAMTGSAPPLAPLTKTEYEQAGLPWFEDQFGQTPILEGEQALRRLQSREDWAPEQNHQPPVRVVKITRGGGSRRE